MEVQRLPALRRHDQAVGGTQDIRLFGDKKEFVYFAPGAIRIAEKASAPVKNRSHTIETEIDFKGYEEGVIVGGRRHDRRLHDVHQGRRLYYDYNYLDGVYYTMASPPLPQGKTKLKFKFTKTVEFGGTGELFVNGKKVAERDMPKMHISTYSLAETFDVGRAFRSASDLGLAPYASRVA